MKIANNYFNRLDPPLGHSPYAIMPNYLYTIGEKFLCTDISEASHAPPTSGGGRAGARGAEIFSRKTGFLQSRSFFSLPRFPLSS
jgi:hypothetical protein